jgi:hypothetical protein
VVSSAPPEAAVNPWHGSNTCCCACAQRHVYMCACSADVHGAGPRSRRRSSTTQRRLAHCFGPGAERGRSKPLISSLPASLLTVDQLLHKRLPDGDGGAGGGGVTHALHKPAVMEAPTRHVLTEALHRVTHHCLPAVLEQSVAVHLMGWGAAHAVVSALLALGAGHLELPLCEDCCIRAGLV